MTTASCPEPVGHGKIGRTFGTGLPNKRYGKILLRHRQAFKQADVVMRDVAAWLDQVDQLRPQRQCAGSDPAEYAEAPSVMRYKAARS